MEKKETKIAAGILLYKVENGKRVVLLLHTGGPYHAKKDDGAWSFPKGELDGPEDLLHAAKREFKEETSFLAPEGNYIELGSVKRPGKIVHVWAVEGDLDASKVKSNTCMVEYPPRSGKQIEIPEMDRGEFFDLETAKKKLYGYLAPIIDKFEENIKP
jgi:predicted NUDIX family NTP pyrophosphohydrolase